MPDDKNIKGDPDISHVSISEDYEVKYWSTKFEVSAGELIDAVRKVGNSPQKVEEYLKSHKINPSL